MSRSLLRVLRKPAGGRTLPSIHRVPGADRRKVNYKGFDAYDVEPETQPDLFAERPVVVFGKWQGAKEGQIEVTGRTATGAFTKLIDVKESTTRLGARSATAALGSEPGIARLSDFNFRGDAEAAREVTSLGLTYSLLTRYTSFIAVLEQVRNTTGNAVDVDQPLPMPDGVSDLAVGFGSGAEPGLWFMLFGAAGLITVVYSSGLVGGRHHAQPLGLRELPPERAPSAWPLA